MPMLRRAKLLVPLIALVVTISASAAADAAEFTSTSYPAKPHGANSQAALVLMTGAGSVTCASTYEGSLASASSTMSISAEYFLCTAFGFVGATVATNECEYRLHVNEVLGETGSSLGSFDIVCPSGKAIRVTAATCEMEIGSQNGLSPVSFFSPGGSGSITVKFENNPIPGFVYTVTKDGFLCPLSGTGKKEGGRFTDSVWLNGFFGEDLGIK